MPVYNVDKYIRKCLDSLINQTLRDIEIIIVNDGSTDTSQAIIDDFVKRYPIKVTSLIKENGGLSDARNYGIPYCAGEYIAFVDSDDYVDVTMYEKMYSEAKRIDADIVTSDYYVTYPSSKIKVKSRSFISNKDMFMDPLAAAWNKIYKKSLLINTGILFPKGLIYEDTEFFCKLIPYINKCGYISEPLVYYVQRSGSITNTQSEKIVQIFQIFKNIKEYYLAQDLYDTYNIELQYFAARVILGSNFERICRIEDKKLRNDCFRFSLEFLDAEFQHWKDNKYLFGWSLRKLYIKAIKKNNVVYIGKILRVIFRVKSNKLFK